MVDSTENPDRGARGAAPDALLLLGTTCPNCPTVLEALGRLVKRGELGRLEVINLEQHPEIAAGLGVRSVPWVRIGSLELVGLRSEAEYLEWIRRARSPVADIDQLRELLATGEAVNVARMVERNPALLDTLLQLLGDEEEKLAARVGIGVVMEELAGSELLQGAVETLGTLSRHPGAAVRADACHYLGLTGAPAARAWLEPRLDDEDETVREIAAESLGLLGN